MTFTVTVPLNPCHTHTMHKQMHTLLSYIHFVSLTNKCSSLFSGLATVNNCTVLRHTQLCPTPDPNAHLSADGDFWNFSQRLACCAYRPSNPMSVYRRNPTAAWCGRADKRVSRQKGIRAEFKFKSTRIPAPAQPCETSSHWADVLSSDLAPWGPEVMTCFNMGYSNCVLLH